VLKRLLKRLASYLPRPLPTGMTAFNQWVEEIIWLSGLPNNASTRKAAASFILQLRPNVGWISLHMTVRLLVKAAANQVALEVLRSSDPKAETVASPLVPEAQG
jgi:hypothetical protein